MLSAKSYPSEMMRGFRRIKVSCMLLTISAALLLGFLAFNIRIVIDRISSVVAGRGNYDQDYDEGTPEVIIYNRLPKTGSTSFMGLVYDLCGINNFYALHLNVSKNAHTLHLVDQLRLAKNISNWNEKKPAVYHGHLAYLDFQRLGVNFSPIYINIVRQPIDRLVSYFYFLRYGDDFRPHLTRKKQGDRMTFDDCVKNSLQECDPVSLWMQIPFFCGHAAQCWEPGNPWALEQAKRNLAEKYLLVGVTEELQGFVEVLELSLPRMFKGAMAAFLSDDLVAAMMEYACALWHAGLAVKQSEKLEGILKRVCCIILSQKYDHLPYVSSGFQTAVSVATDVEGNKSHLRRTNTKFPPSDETLQKIKKSRIWQMENEFYKFALHNFQTSRKRLLESVDNRFSRQEFFYEKIRPKK